MVVLVVLSSDVKELLWNAADVDASAAQSPGLASSRARAHVVEECDCQTQLAGFCCAAYPTRATAYHDEVVYMILIVFEGKRWLHER